MQTAKGSRSRVSLTGPVAQDEAVTMVEEAEELTDALRTQVLFAREYLKSVTIGPKQVTVASFTNCTYNKATITDALRVYRQGCNTYPSAIQNTACWNF